ncbi:3-phosphoshikimate 1-carboxyvinyltransferase [Candidatus Bathyarchaeota archaeon]|nr:3-phosphoshikimate 1-carboxyvinyltransferase [Candidatus Bathyarchaeota archaeon]
MVDAIINRTENLRGEVSAPPSKSYSQRMLIAALMSNGTSKISKPLFSKDTNATLRVARALGSKVHVEEDSWMVEGSVPPVSPKHPINCGESGATLRFMVPIAALSSGPSIFDLSSSLARRPIEPLLNSLRQLGAKTTIQQKNGRHFIKVHGGGIQGGKTEMPGDISSQFISGLMFACPRAEHDTEIALTTPLESKVYIQMTADVLSKHGIHVGFSEDFKKVFIPSKQEYHPSGHVVPGDFSSAAFLLAAAAITHSGIRVKNLHCEKLQGDKAIIGILQDMGVNLKVYTDQIDVEPKDNYLLPLTIDVTDIPDLVPVCAVLACYANGTSRINNAHRLRYKESNRLLSLHKELGKMGAKIMLEANSFRVRGPCALKGSTIDPHNDHRIAMACSVAALRAEGMTRIKDSECVKKSYPEFFNHLRLLGADVIGGEFDR